MTSVLDDIIARLNNMPAAELEETAKVIAADLGGLIWVPNLGAQTEGYYCEADELFYGGSAGGGKSDLLFGLALTAQDRSLILRRTNKEAGKLVERLAEIVGNRNGWNGQDDVWRFPDGRLIDVGGCQLEHDKQKYKGTPHDFIGFDEISDFSEDQYRFITTWNRSTKPGQRCRVVAAGNPPTRPEGLWVIQYWAPWLDKRHPNPAKPGELRWYTTIGGEEKEVDGPGPYQIGGMEIRARSRTYIPARLSDNPDLERTDYGAVLAALPKELRAAYLEGRFDAGLKDNPFQVIPTAWVEAAMERWKEDGRGNYAMSAIGFDPAGGGDDSAELAIRYGGWFAPLVSAHGKITEDGSAAAAMVFKHRRDNCVVVVDVGGGYGGSVIMRLSDNGIGAHKFDGASTSTAKAQDGSKLSFRNKRAEAHWRMREALDPENEGADFVCLPPDPELKADLCAPTWELTQGGILIENKDNIRKRIGRSPNKGDACIMALAEGNTAIKKRMGMNHDLPSRASAGYESIKRLYRR